MLKISWNLLELYIEQYVQTTKQGMKNEKKWGKKGLETQTGINF